MQKNHKTCISLLVSSMSQDFFFVLRPKWKLPWLHIETFELQSVSDSMENILLKYVHLSKLVFATDNSCGYFYLEWCGFVVFLHFLWMSVAFQTTPEMQSLY